MTLHAPRIDMHERMLEEMSEAIDQLTLRSTPGKMPRYVRFTKILVGHDATPESKHALEWAGTVARLHGAEATVASIAPALRSYADGPLGMGSYWPGMLVEHERVEREMREAAENGAAYLRVNGVPAARAVSEMGSPVAELARLARSERVDLVVLGARGGGHVSRIVLGSVAEALTGRVDASMLVARDAPDLHHVLVATDGSPESDRAVTLALEIANARHSDLVVQHVLEHPGDPAALPPEGYLQGIIERMSLPNHPHVRYIVDVGRPADKIVKRAQAEGCSLIVMGAQGVGRLRGLLLGSVSHRVANTTHASVLLVRGEPDA